MRTCRAALLLLGVLCVGSPVAAERSGHGSLPASAMRSCEDGDCELVSSIQLSEALCVRVSFEADERGVPTSAGTGDPDWFVAPLQAGVRCEQANYSFVPERAFADVARAVSIIVAITADSVEVEGDIDSRTLRCALAQSRVGFTRVSANRHEPDPGAAILEVDACGRRVEFVVPAGQGAVIRLRETVPVVHL